MRFSPALITDNWVLKLTALGLALLLWSAVRSEETSRFTMRTVPVEVRLTEEDWVRSGEADPQTVSVDFVGPVRELLRVAFAEPTLVIPVEDVEDTVELYRPRPEWLEIDGRFENLRVDQIRPAAVSLPFQPIESRMVPVAVRLATPLPPGLRLLEAPSSRPAQVRVEGPRNRLEALDSVLIHVPDVEGALRNGEARLLIDTTGLGLQVSPLEVRVRLPVAPANDTTAATTALRRGPARAGGRP